MQIYRGVLTGYNEAFIINGETRAALIAKQANSADIIRPILRGRDIKKWYADYQDLWLISTFPSLNININDYKSIKEYLLEFGKHRLEQDGKGRKKTGNEWFETQDQISYYENFTKPKIIYPNMTKYMPFIYDENGYFTNQKCFIITGNNLAYLTIFLNSNLFKVCFRENFPELLGGTRELSKIFFDKIPVKKINDEQDAIFNALIQRILNEKDNIITLEKQANQLIYELYNLTENEIQTIEKSDKVIEFPDKNEEKD